MLNKYELDKLTKKKLVNEYLHLKQWSAVNTVKVSAIEALMVKYKTINSDINIIESSLKNPLVDSRDIIKDLQIIIKEAKDNK